MDISSGHVWKLHFRILCIRWLMLRAKKTNNNGPLGAMRSHFRIRPLILGLFARNANTKKIEDSTNDVNVLSTFNGVT